MYVASIVTIVSAKSNFTFDLDLLFFITTTIHFTEDHMGEYLTTQNISYYSDEGMFTSAQQLL